MRTLKPAIKHNIEHIKTLITDHYTIVVDDDNLFLSAILNNKPPKRYNNNILVEITLNDGVDVSVDDLIKASYFNKFMTAQIYGRCLWLIVKDCNSISQLEQVFNVIRRNTLLGRIEKYSITMPSKVLTKLALDVTTTYSSKSVYFRNCKIFHMNNTTVVKNMIDFETQKRGYIAPLSEKIYSKS